MLAFFRSILDWIKSLFWKEEMELTLVGLQYSGKTTFVNVIAVSLTGNLKLRLWLSVYGSFLIVEFFLEEHQLILISGHFWLSIL